MKASLGRIGGRILILAPALLIGLTLTTGAALAAWVSLGGDEGSLVDVEVIESTEQRVVIEYTLGGFYAEPVQIEGSTYYALTLPEESNRLDTGLPELPHVCRSIIIPDQDRMDVRIVSIEWESLAGYPVIPSKGNFPRTIDPADVPYRFGSIYQSASWYPDEIVSDREPYILRDYRGMVVDITPFKVRCSDGSLQVVKHMVIEVVSDGLGMQNTIDRAGPPTKVVREFSEIYGNHFINWGRDRYVPVDEMGTMLVITHDSFYDAMVPFVEWKKQRGMPTEIVNISAIGNNQTAIDAHIEQAYLNDGVAFVLLVGDRAQVASYLVGGNESDPTYSLIAGGDNYPELFVGRFSAETIDHAETQADRTIGYEKTPMIGADWYHKGMGVASNEGPGDDGEYDNEHMDVIRGKLMAYGYTEVDQIYAPSGTAAMVSAALNEGRSTANYTGHGGTTNWVTTGFSNSNINALTSEWMLPFITSVACVNGDFGSTTCFGEAWLRATHNGNPTGAIAAYMASINQSWYPPMCGQDEVIDLLVDDEMRTFGGLCYNGSCQMMDEYASSGENEFNHWHIFGDPSVMVRTATPVAMTAQHDGMLLIGQSSYSVLVPGVVGAACALYADGVLYGSAYTDLTGAATITLDPIPNDPITLTLTATGYNKIPVIESVEVLPPDGPFIVFSDYEIVDEEGARNGLCDAGETDGLLLYLGNVGVDPATDVSATLSTEDTYVTITVDEQAVQDILPDSTGTCFEPYVIEINPNTPDQHMVLFTVEVVANEGTWSCNFSVPIQAPVLTPGICMIDDSVPFGNGNGVADPNESFFLQLGLPNTGHSDARGLTGILSCMHPSVQILDNEGICLNAPAGGAGVLSAYEINLLPSCPSPTTLELRVQISNDNGFTERVDYMLSVGAFFDDAEDDMGWTLGAAGDDASTGQWVRVDPNGTTYNGGDAQPEDDHTADPAVNCFVTGQGSVGGTAGEADVDGGKTTLLSPVFDLDDAISASVEYWRWYTNDLGNNPGQDTWYVDVTSNGVDWVSLEQTMESANSWNQYSFDLGAYIDLTDQVQIRFIAEDLSPGSLVEAAVDDFALIAVRVPTTDVAGGEILESFGLVSCKPNPFNPRMRIVYRLGSETQAELAVYDVSGRMVRSLVDERVDAGEHVVEFDGVDSNGNALPSGIYFLRLDTPEILEIRQVTLLK